MRNCKDCVNYKLKLAGRWQKIWEVDYDFAGGTGVFPMWVCLFFPILGPVIYLVYYYACRERIKDEAGKK